MRTEVGDDLYELSEWQCWLLGDRKKSQNVIWNCPLGLEPNAFHRWMQRLCFGVVWKRRSAQ